MTRRNLCLFLTASLVLASLLSLPPRPGAAESPPPEVSTVRIGTWNIEWLGKVERRRSGAQDAEDIARYLLASKVDLLGLNEISDDDNAEATWTNRTLTRALAILKDRTGKEWKYVLFPKENREEKDQLCGVAWNAARVHLVGEPMRVPLRRPTGSSLWNRHPHAAKFSFGKRKTDIVVVPVHMKSNYGGEAVTSRQRADEAKALIRSLGALQNQFTDDDVVILGDFNCKSGDDLALKRYGLAGFRDLNEKDNKSWIKSSRYAAAPFDRILVPDDQPEFKDCSFTVFKEHHLKTEAEFRKRLSDHYLVVTEIKVIDDDD